MSSTAAAAATAAIPSIPRDEEGPVFRAPWEAHAFAMALWKKGNEVSSVGVDPLIDGLVADGKSGAVAADAACDEFGRPAQTELGLDIGAQ